ncbi:hypothetical protein JW707_04845 [Candidatus Woesearchaeota archaeon]|nr:hypothetical protein [Candidatus Woesearchaeota archaeon]
MSSDLTIPEKIITRIERTGLPLPRNGQTTDDQLPAKFLNEISFKPMGQYAYFNERYVEGDLNRPNPDHVMNLEAYAHAGIVFAGTEYGTGSSREHAPQGLLRWNDGIQAIVAKSFADLFIKNCQNIGIVGVTAAPEIVDKLVGVAQKDSSMKFVLDLESKTISYNGNKFDVDLPESRRLAFLTGTWYVSGVLLKREALIKAKEAELPYLRFE